MYPFASAYRSLFVMMMLMILARPRPSQDEEEESEISGLGLSGLSGRSGLNGGFGAGIGGIGVAEQHGLTDQVSSVGPGALNQRLMIEGRKKSMQCIAQPGIMLDT